LAIADLDNMDFGNDTRNYTLTVTWYTQLAKVTIAPIGSMLKLTGDVSCFFCENKHRYELLLLPRTNICGCLHIRKLDDNTYQPTTWQIKFNLDSVSPSSTYKFRVALASSALAELQVISERRLCSLFPICIPVFFRQMSSLKHSCMMNLLAQIFFNDQDKALPHFATGLIGRDNAIARHGIHGLYWLFNIDVASAWLVQGVNTIYLKQPRSLSPFQGLMYDYLRLEGPCGC